MMNRRHFFSVAAGAAMSCRAATVFAAQASYDLIIRGGRVIDPSLQLDAVRDVAISGGRIAAVEAGITAKAAELIDARGKIVTPGLIDIHTHCARDSRSSGMVLRDGVTGWIDAGSQGADRIADAAFAVAKLSLPAMVVDLGTATTFDIITKERTYEGGAIAPGVGISTEILSLRTSKLPVVEIQFPRSVVGKTTVECIQSGVLYGHCDLISGYIHRVEGTLQQKFDVALTGGLSFLFTERLGVRVKHLPNLTLEGILSLYQFNQKRT